MHILGKFGEKEHLEALQTGRLRFRPLSSYKAGTGRGKPWHDPMEGISFSHSPKFTKFEIDMLDGRRFVFGQKEGLHSIVESISPRRSAILCFYAISLENYLDGGRSCEDIIKIPPRMRDFGSHILLFSDFQALLSRIEVAIKGKRILIEGSRVQYIDPSEHHGPVRPNMIGFVKDQQLAFQSEYRLKVSLTEDVPDPFFIDVADLSDVSTIFSVDDLNGRKVFCRPASNDPHDLEAELP